jgi:hypothetical protein
MKPRKYTKKVELGWINLKVSEKISSSMQG